MNTPSATSEPTTHSAGPAPHSSSEERLRVGVIGCGGRGSGAALNAVNAASNVEIYAMADLFRDRLETSVEQLKEHTGEAFNVPPERQFVGFDGYKQVLDTGVDYVILATPPYYRPQHLEATVEADTHAFIEKPVAVDPPGVRRILEAGKKAEEKGLSIIAGTIYRRQDNFVQGIERIHEGQIGYPRAGRAFYLTGSIWLRERQSGMSDLEWQCRNWYYFTWLSGDHIVEQFVHNLDTINWVLHAHPVKAEATGGRQVRVDPSYGHIYDHFSVVFTYPDDTQVRAMCRQMDRTQHETSNWIMGTHGVAELNPGETILRSHDGEVLFEKEKGDANPYVTEHTDLIRSIRQNDPINEAEQIAHSTMTGILGREAAYTGQTLTWRELMRSDVPDLGPEKDRFGSASIPPIPEPGRTTLTRSW